MFCGMNIMIGVCFQVKTENLMDKASDACQSAKESCKDVKPRASLFFFFFFNKFTTLWLMNWIIYISVQAGQNIKAKAAGAAEAVKDALEKWSISSLAPVSFLFLLWFVYFCRAEGGALVCFLDKEIKRAPRPLSWRHQLNKIHQLLLVN